MEKLNEINLGNAGIEYVKASLADGKSLSQILLQTFNFQKGKAITFLPADVSVQHAKQFKTGGKLKRADRLCLSHADPAPLVGIPTPTLDCLLVSNILSFLNGGKDRLCIMEDALAKPSDPGIDPFRERILTFKQEVYYRLLHEDAQEATIATIVKCAYSHWFTGILTSFPQDGFAPMSGEITLDDLKSYALRTEKIIIGAYDGEGYVICEQEN